MSRRRDRARIENEAAPLRTAWEDVEAAARTTRFRVAVLRQLVIVGGVLVFDWPSIDVGLFFVVESWLYLSLRATAEIALDPRYATPPVSGALPVAWTIFKHWLVAGPLIGLFVFPFGGLAVGAAFPSEDWTEFWANGWREPSFLFALGFLVVSLVVDTARFAQSLALRSDSQRRADDTGIRVMFARVLLLCGAAVLLGFAAKIGVGGKVLVVVIAGVILAVEAMPQRMASIFEASRGGPPRAG